MKKNMYKINTLQYAESVRLEWDSDKNKLLKRTRNVCFEQVREEIEKGAFIGPEKNPSRANQQRIIIKLNDYPYVVPLVVMENGGWFLKTIYPDRKMKGRI